MAKEPTITVNHYLNTNLKPFIVNGKNLYKVYVLIRANSQNTKIRSLATNDEYTIDEYDSYINDNESELSKNVRNEIEFLEMIVNHIHKDKKKFSASLFTDYWNIYKQPISEVDEEIKEVIKDFKENKAFNIPLILKKAEKDYEFLMIKEQISKFEPRTLPSNILVAHLLNMFLEDEIHRFTNLFPENYDVKDLYIGQWIFKDIKNQFQENLINYVGRSSLNSDRPDGSFGYKDQYIENDAIISFVNALDTEIKIRISNYESASFVNLAIASMIADYDPWKHFTPIKLKKSKVKAF